VNELFRHIYNEEKEAIEKLKMRVFPQLESGASVDALIVQAIDASMNIVKDQLKQTIKKQLTHTHTIKSTKIQRSCLEDFGRRRGLHHFELNSDNFKQFLDVV
jgi:hypothetical protein